MKAHNTNASHGRWWQWWRPWTYNDDWWWKTTLNSKQMNNNPLTRNNVFQQGMYSQTTIWRWHRHTLQNLLPETCTNFLHNKLEARLRKLLKPEIVPNRAASYSAQVSNTRKKEVGHMLKKLA